MKPSSQHSDHGWSMVMHFLFKKHGYAALYVEGPEHPIPRKFGDNMGGWPVMMGVTKSWKDEITRHANRHSPYHWQGLLFRVWTTSEAAAKQLQATADKSLRATGEALKMSWLDLGRDSDPAVLEFQLHDLARQMGMTSWDDVGFVEHLREQEQMEARKARRGMR